MQHFKTTFARVASVAAFATTLSAGAAWAEEMVLSSWLPPQHPVVTGVIEPWAAQVAEVTDGRVTVRILPRPLGPPPAHFDLAADGDADIVYGLHSFTSDNRFLRSRIGQFSFLGDDAVATSQAYYNVYTETLDAAAEHEGTHLLSLWVHGPGMFHNNQRAIERAADFEGLKVRVPGGYISEMVEVLGATTQFMGPGDVFERLSTGVIDGVTFPMEALRAFNLAPHLTNTLTVPGGLYNTSWFMVMNEDKWTGLSAEDQAAISEISGATLAGIAGEVWNGADAGGLEAANDAGVVIAPANDAVMAVITEYAASAEAAWAAELDAQGFDGAAALEDMRAQAAP
jgi:TRAP-type C4-dicarboxylate transport system substrate-binding protein